MPEFHVLDVEYQRSGDRPMLARLYRPKGAGPFPAVVDVHGGAWTSGDRSMNASIHEALAPAGIVVLALDFRQPPEAGYPQSLQDISLGIRWLKANARQCGTAADRVGALATSSGAQQLMSVALRPRDPLYAALPLAEAPEVDASLAFACLGWPVLDPLARYRMVRERGTTRLVEAHHAFFPDEAAMAEGNPQLIVERGAQTHQPPLLILQGTADDNLTPDMADRFVAAYAKAGGAAELHKFEGQPHTFATRDPKSEAALRAVTLMKEFILRGAG